MKINIDTISTAVYAIRKNFQGYKLLKNPKGAPPTEINMMKSSFGVYGIYILMIAFNTIEYRENLMKMVKF